MSIVGRRFSFIEPTDIIMPVGPRTTKGEQTMFWGKGREIGNRIDYFLQAVNDCAELFKDFFYRFLKGDNLEQLADLVTLVREAESRCDELRHDIETRLFEGALMPAARGDIFNVLETTDKVPNKMESVCDMVYLQGMKAPEFIREDMKLLVDRTMDCTRALTEALKSMFRDAHHAKELTTAVSERESEVDKVERDMVKKLFQREDLQLAEKMHLRELITQITAISDRAENAADRIEIMAVKRKA